MVTGRLRSRLGLYVNLFLIDDTRPDAEPLSSLFIQAQSEESTAKAWECSHRPISSCSGGDCDITIFKTAKPFLARLHQPRRPHRILLRRKMKQEVPGQRNIADTSPQAVVIHATT